MMLVTLADERPWADRGGGHRLLLTRRGQRSVPAAAAAGSPHVAGPPPRDLSRDELAAAAASIEVTWLYRRRGHPEGSIAGEPCYTRNQPANPRRGDAHQLPQRRTRPGIIE
jgi:hypothetical protein